MTAGADLPRSVAARERVVFLGDSLTAYGWTKKDGWVRQVVAQLAAQGVKLHPLCSGVPGNRSIDLLARFERDVVAPDSRTRDQRQSSSRSLPLGTSRVQ